MWPFKDEKSQKQMSIILTFIGVGIMFLQPIPNYSTTIGFIFATVGIIYLVEVVS